MARPNLPEPISASEQEQLIIKRMVQLFRSESSQAKLVGSDGEEIPLPESLYHALRDTTTLLSRGHAVVITPADHEFSTQQAAEFLNVSRPFLLKLLKEGQIPHHMVGSHRRIRFDDLSLYKGLRDRKRREGMKQLIQMSEELDLYDDDDFLEEN
jgi:excisionase family DNA binding protein